MIDYRLRTSSQYLDDARLLLQNGRWNNAVARAYYASYQAMWAALGDPTEERLWRHLPIIKHFVRGYWFQQNHPTHAPGLLEHLRLPLRRLYLARIQCDYEATPISEAVAKTAVQTADQTLRAIEERRRES